MKQKGLKIGDRDIDKNVPVGEIIANPKFLEAGKFPELPGNIKLPQKLYYCEQPGSGKKDISFDKPTSPILERIGHSMTRQWDFLYERASLKPNNCEIVNINTRSRYIYNTFCVRQIINNLEERNNSSGRVLLVTAYETPIHELLESEWISEVHVVDLSPKAFEVIAEKYTCHSNADKLHLKILDYSCIDPEFLETEINGLIRNLNNCGLADIHLIKHFTKISSGEHFSKLGFDNASFDAVHLPFVLGSLHLTPLTAIVDHFRNITGRKERVDYKEFINENVLVSDEAQESAIAVIRHTLNESKQILKSNGLMIINLWARPLFGRNGMVKLSDVVVPAAKISSIMNDFNLLFSGNPQPNLPHTVAHILGYRKTGNE